MDPNVSARAGTISRQASGYAAVVPAALPVDPPLRFDAEMVRLLDEASLALGRLGGISSFIPNPHLFVAMYVRKEAIESSRIENIEATLEEVLQTESGTPATRDLAPLHVKDVAEVVNRVSAMNYGMASLDDTGPGGLPLSQRLIREVHAQLMSGARGGTKRPGDFRTSQNWIGPSGATLATATFVPPPPPEMHAALDNLETFLRDRSTYPVRVQCAVAHAQFETIRPFLDGNAAWVAC